MGLFDNIKSAIHNAAQGLKDGLDEAMTKDIHTLCDELKEYKELDPKRTPILMAINHKCDEINDFDLEDLYLEYKKQGSLLKKHPAEKVLVEALIKRRIYIPSDNGTITRNMFAKRRPK